MGGMSGCRVVLPGIRGCDMCRAKGTQRLSIPGWLKRVTRELVDTFIVKRGDEKKREGGVHE